MELKRRRFLKSCVAATAAVWFSVENHRTLNSAIQSFELDEITIANLQNEMKSGKFTARSVTEKYLARIEQIDKHGPALNSVIEINPDALAIAEALDTERKRQGVRGPLHGIPILLKDNINTA